MAPVNNEIYETLGERWYNAWDDPVALLRAENELLNPWVLSRIRNNFLDEKMSVLDVGCGGGFLSNYLAENGYKVTGLDLSGESLRVARDHDRTHSVHYVEGDALHLPFPDASFDVVTSMDFLEHVAAPARVIDEIGRVLRPGGLFFYHTFNRNLASWFLVIKCVEWLVKNTPKDMHVIELFIKPSELAEFCRQAGMEPVELKGVKPVIGSIRLKNLLSGVVPTDMRFEFTRSTLISYLGYARKNTGTTV